MNVPQDRPPRGARPAAPPIAAHRHGALRFCLAVVAATEAGAFLDFAATWTPGRLVFAGVALGLGAAAALTAVVLMGTSRPIGKALGAVIAVALAGSLLGSASASTMSDPTQVRVSDLDLSITCTVSPDLQSVVATAEFRWHRLDVGPQLTAAPGTDRLDFYSEQAEFLLPKLQAPLPAGGRASLVRPGASTRANWGSSTVGSASLTTDGRPSWPRFMPADTTPDFGPAEAPRPYTDTVEIGNGGLRAGATYGATWTLASRGTASFPVFMVEYRHRARFTVQAFGSCGDPKRSWPNRSAESTTY